MKPRKLTDLEYLGILNDLVPKGWIPDGDWQTFFFWKSGVLYDLSAADLTKLDYIEKNGLFTLARFKDTATK